MMAAPPRRSGARALFRVEGSFTAGKHNAA